MSPGESSAPDAAGRARAIAQLLRVPNLFTAAVNPAAGYLAARPAVPGADLAAAMGASVLLYATGVVLNDYADRAIDAVERPERPIPRGAVRPVDALRLGVGLALGALALAAVAGLAALAVAVALLGVVALYDFAWKPRAPLGALGMGLARGLNVLLGVAAAGGFVALGALAWIALPLGLFAAGLTLLARGEVQRGSELARAAGGALALAGALLPLAFHVGGLLPRADLVPFGIAFALTGGGAAAVACARPDPPVVRRAVGHGVLSLPILDAALAAAFVGALPGALLLAGGAGAFALSRAFAVT